MLAPKNALSFGAGTLLYASIGTALPDYTIVNSIFTGPWGAGWNLLGVTREGHDFTIEMDSEEVEVAEYLDPVANVITGRNVGMEFELLQLHATNMRRVFNGGTLTTSGSGTTLRTTYKLPQPGQEIRCMIGWESTDQTERIVAQQAFQVGSVSISRKKGAANAGLPVSFKFEPDANGDPFLHDFAGALRG
jgi:hypothetical protein